MSLTLTNVPAIMRSKGWANGARLQDIWFSRSSAIAPAYGAADTATIKMESWVLKFDRARIVYEKLIADRFWANPAAQEHLTLVLQRKSLLTRTAMSFGSLTDTADAQDADAINYRVVGFSLGDLDDMSAALGNFVFKVVAYGVVRPGSSGDYQVTIAQVGVYVRDSFDFNGDQFLGFWDDSDNAVSMINPLSGTSVSNATYRDHRARTGRGGDFLVFSDVKWSVLTTPDVINIHPKGAPSPTPGPVSPPSPIPAPPVPSLPAPAMRTVEVHRGDTLSGIAKSAYGSYELWPLLWDANRSAVGPNPNLLKIGTKLQIPPVGSFSSAQINDAKRRAPDWKSY